MKKVIIGFFAAVFMMSSCDCNKKIASENVEVKEVVSSSVIEVIEFSRQYTVPGVESNLRGSHNYKIVLNTNFKDSTLIEFFHVDSIRIPVKSILVDGKRWKSTDFLIGEIKGLTLLLSRNIYNTSGSNANRNLSVIKYDLSGDQLAQGEGALVYTSKNSELTSITTTFPLGQYTNKENLYRP